MFRSLFILKCLFLLILQARSSFTKVEKIVYNMINDVAALNNTWYFDNTTIQQKYLSQLASIYQHINKSNYSSLLDTNVWVDFARGELLIEIGDTVNVSQFSQIKSKFELINDIDNNIEKNTDDNCNVTFDCFTIGTNEDSIPSFCIITYANAWINSNKAVRYFRNLLDESLVPSISKNDFVTAQDNYDDSLAIRSDKKAIVLMDIIITVGMNGI